MARTFTRASQHYITVSLGSIGVWGGTTVAALVKKASDPSGYNAIICGGEDADPNAWILYVNETDHKLGMWNGSVDRFATFTVTNAEGWVLVAATKASGTATTRFHKYVFNTNAWTHADTTDGTAGNSSDPNLAGSGKNRISIGRHYASGSTDGYFDGDIAAAGFWNAVLTDSQVEALAYSLRHWFAVNPAGVWVLDQSSTGQNLIDTSGHGSNQTGISGTAVSTNSVPIFSYGHEITFVEVAHAGAVTATYTGAITPAGALVKAVAKTLAGAITPAGALSKAVAKTLAGAVTPAGALTKAVAKTMAGAVTPAGSIAKAISKSAAGSCTPAGSCSNGVAKGLAGAATPAGSIANGVAKTLSGSITPAGDLTLEKTSGGTEYFGESTVSLVDTVTTTGMLTAFASSTCTETVTVTTTGTRTAMASSTCSLVDTVTTSGTLLAFGSSTCSEVVTVTTTGYATRFGSCAVAETVTITTNGVRICLGSSSVALVVAITTNGDRIAVTSSTVSLVDTITTSPGLLAFGVSTVVETVVITTDWTCVPNIITIDPADDEILTLSTVLADSLTLSLAGSESLTLSPAAGDSLTLTPAGDEDLLLAPRCN